MSAPVGRLDAELWGVDFTSAPTVRKPIVLARGRLLGKVVRLSGLSMLPTMAEFETLLQTPGPWCAGLDLPFGLPRAFVESQQLGQDSAAVMASVLQRCPRRMDFRAFVDAWGNTQPAGKRLLHRRTDAALPGVQSTSPMQTRYVPVGFMYFEGYSRLLKAGVDVPRLVAGDPQRVALEAYPGFLAFELLGRRGYKNDDSGERLLARKDLLEALEQGRTRLGLRLKLTPAQAGAVVADSSGDRLDAVMCLMQATWSLTQPDHGLPQDVDAVEGWILSA